MQNGKFSDNSFEPAFSAFEVDEDISFTDDVKERVWKWIQELPNLSIDGEAVPSGSAGNTKKTKYTFLQSPSALTMSSAGNHVETKQLQDKKEASEWTCVAGIMRRLRK